MAVNPSVFGPCPQFETTTGVPAVGTQLFFYVAGSTGTKQNTYTNSTGTVANPNPIVLNALGQPTNEIWWTNGMSYKVVWAPSTDTDPPTNPIRTWDNLRGINDTTLSATQSEWVLSPLTPTFVSSTSFTLTGNQTATFNVGRRLQTTNTGGTVYSTIKTSVFSTVTTVTVVNTFGVLDSGLSAVSYGILSNLNTSEPAGVFEATRIDVASAATTDLTALAPSSRNINLTGTATITAFTIASGQLYFVRLNGATLTNNAAIVTQTSNNILSGTGDTCIIRATADNVVEVLSYSFAAGAPKQIQSVSATAATNTMVVSLNPTSLDFRSTNLTSGTINTRTLATISNITIPQGATLGANSSVPMRTLIGAIDNAGTVEPVIVSGIAAPDLTETNLINTTAISNAANSSNVFYSTTARTLAPVRWLGYYDANQTTAGTHAAQPSAVQGLGGSVPISTPIYTGSNLAVDVPMSVGQTITYDITAQTSYALHIATGDNQLYELKLLLTGNSTTSGQTVLNPNNTTYANFFVHENAIASAAAVAGTAVYLNAMPIAMTGDIKMSVATISTKTVSKNCVYTCANLFNGANSYMGVGIGMWLATASTQTIGDTTTAWTSLGTITFPVAATGRIIVRRIA